MNMGIITASMPAMPQFFGKSKIFKTETYSSLRSRLFPERSRRRASRTAEEAKQSKKALRYGPEVIEQQANKYLELEDVSHFRPFEGDTLHEEDDSSHKGILNSTGYGVSSATQPGKCTTRQEIEEP